MSIALVHDYLTQRGGAERVVLSMVRAFPHAPVYTSLYSPSRCFPEFHDVNVLTSRLNAIPLFRRQHRLAFPLLARAFSSQVIDADTTLVSSSGWAHGVCTTGRKIVYCHAPARWLYQPRHYLRQRGPMARVVLTMATRKLIDWDIQAARSADQYLVNSTVVRERVREAYGIDAEVVHPPHRIDASGPQRAVPGLSSGFVLCVARLQAYKNVDVVVAAMDRLRDMQLVVVGSGPLLPRLKRVAGRNVSFVGKVSDSNLRWLYENAALLVAASHEDFGLTPVEAAAFGVPTIALRAGGFLDTVEAGRTGLFFNRLDPEEIAAVIDTAARTRWNHASIRNHAQQFSEQRFVGRLKEVIAAQRDHQTGTVR